MIILSIIVIIRMIIIIDDKPLIMNVNREMYNKLLQLKSILVADEHDDDDDDDNDEADEVDDDDFDDDAKYSYIIVAAQVHFGGKVDSILTVE